MPSIEITSEQHERFAAIREELAAAHAGKYASVQPTDVMAYLLDVAEAADDPTAVSDGESETTAETTAGDDGEDTTEAADEPSATAAADAEATDDDGASSGGPGMLNLLEDHDEKWREGGGDAPYEVDLPDGGTETARTRDDVKAILFKHY
jgi:hypothetical protein